MTRPSVPASSSRTRGRVIVGHQRWKKPTSAAPTMVRPRNHNCLQSPTADKDRLAGTARRVDRGVGDRDASIRWIQGQAGADGDGAKPVGVFLWVEPMTVEEKKVITTSQSVRRSCHSHPANVRRTVGRKPPSEEKSLLPVKIRNDGAGNTMRDLGDDGGGSGSAIRKTPAGPVPPDGPDQMTAGDGPMA